MTKPAKTKYTYVVEGSKYGEFPLDMLRRDESKAASPDDQALIDRLVSMGEDKADLPKTVRVSLTTISTYAPHIERWKSFGWRVIASNHPRSYDLPDTAPDPSEPLHPDDLRQKTMKALAAEVVKLRGLVHSAAPAYMAISYAVDVAAQDRVNRAQAIGYVTATQQIIRSGDYPGLFNSKDKDALGEALEYARVLLMYDDEDRIRRLCDGDRLDTVCKNLNTIREMFA